MKYKSFGNIWEGIWWGYGFVCVDRVVVKEYFFFEWLYGNIICFYKGGFGEYFNINGYCNCGIKW